MIELADVLDESGEPTGEKKTKYEIFEQGLWRLVVHVWIVNPDTNQVLIQKRATKKGIFDDLWDISVGGAVMAGEKSVVAASRETEEELGLKFKEDEFELIGRFKIPKFIPERKQQMNEFSDTFLVRGKFNLDDVTMQEAEVADVVSISLDALIQAVSGADSPNWVPHGKEYYEKVTSEIKELL